MSRRKEVTKIQAEVNKRETKRTIEKINETQIWFFEKRSKINKSLDSPRKKEVGLK